MDKNSDASKKVNWWPLWLTFLVIIFLWGMSIIVLFWLFPDIGVRGQFGDTFGAVNALPPENLIRHVIVLIPGHLVGDEVFHARLRDQLRQCPGIAKGIRQPEHRRLH